MTGITTEDEPWEKLVDVAKLQGWMDAERIGQGPIADTVALTGGTQNVLLRFRRGDCSYVLRRPPAFPRGDGNVTNRREARMLRALSGSSVPHPKLIAACSSDAVLGAAFYLMEPVEGFNATIALPRLHASHPSVRRSMGFALVNGILDLGRVDHVAANLQDFGKPDGFLERQVPRWKALLESYCDYKDWPGSNAIPGISIVADWLSRNAPKSFCPGLIHGDYHLANVMFKNDGPGLAAIVDWELATVGDPLLDMGWIMATWPGPDGRTSGSQVTPWNGFPEIEELIAHYRAGSDRKTSELLWYGVLACYKMGIILEGTYARACAGLALRETGEQLHQSCLKLFNRALRWLDHDTVT
jgi:aminoglycoside phosphotransferase (APT) family kinase protein